MWIITLFFRSYFFFFFHHRGMFTVRSIDHIQRSVALKQRRFILAHEGIIIAMNTWLHVSDGFEPFGFATSLLHRELRSDGGEDRAS